MGCMRFPLSVAEVAEALLEEAKSRQTDYWRCASRCCFKRLDGEKRHDGRAENRAAHRAIHI